MDKLKTDYHLAAADFLIAARSIATAAARLSVAAQAWDPEGTQDDPTVGGMVATARDLLALACLTSPGVRDLFAFAAAPKEQD